MEKLPPHLKQVSRTTMKIKSWGVVYLIFRVLFNRLRNKKSKKK